MNQDLQPALEKHCFALSRAAQKTSLLAIDCSELSQQQALDLANCLPFLACGEESAVHAFSSSLLKHITPEEQAAMHKIAEDELRHAMWLESLRIALPAPTLHLPHDMMARFFKRLLTRQPALHFARVAALDKAVCQLLAPMVHEHAALNCAPQVRDGLIAIIKDEARHVQVAKNMAIKLGATKEELSVINLQIQTELNQLLLPIAPCMQRLGEHQVDYANN